MKHNGCKTAVLWAPRALRSAFNLCVHHNLVAASPSVKNNEDFASKYKFLLCGIHSCRCTTLLPFPSVTMATKWPPTGNIVILFFRKFWVGFFSKKTRNIFKDDFLRHLELSVQRLFGEKYQSGTRRMRNGCFMHECFNKYCRHNSDQHQIDSDIFSQLYFKIEQLSTRWFSLGGERTGLQEMIISIWVLWSWQFVRKSITEILRKVDISLMSIKQT